MPLTSKELVKLLKQNGYIPIGQTGSHLKLKHYKTRTIVVVPIHSRDLGKGLEQAILKQAGIRREE